MPNFICILYKYNNKILCVYIAYTEARRGVLSSAPL
jgi:hypothetical protein